MRSSINPLTSVDNSGFSRFGTASFGLASGALLAAFSAAPAYAQIYNANLTTSAANPNIFFSTTTGASSFATFTGATHELSFLSGGDDTVGGIATTSGVSTYFGNTSCTAARYTAGASIDALSAFNANIQYSIDTQNGWSYPGSGYVGLDYIPVSGTTYYGWASINLAADHTLTLNNFAMQLNPNTAILAGATPAASAAPEPDAVALLALGASGLAAFRLRRKAQAAAEEQAATVAG